MRHVPIDRILVPEKRQRQEFNPNAETELAESIATVGLINPLLVRYSGSDIVLVSGERRLRAIKKLMMLDRKFYCNGDPVNPGLVPCLALGTDVTELLAMEAELDENIRRMDLTWQERADATKHLYDLRRAKDPKYNQEQLAKELGVSPMPISTNLVLARNLHDPDVAKAKTAGDAMKIIVKKENEAKNELHAAMIGRDFTAKQHTLLMGDCIEIMKSMPDGSFDVILTDPPYGMNADEFGNAAGKLLTIDHQYSDSPANFMRLMNAVAPEVTRLAKIAAHLYVCCDNDGFHFLRQLFEKHGWNVFRTPIINFKQGSGRVPLPEHGPRRCWEPILYAYRGGRKCTAIYGDVIQSHAEGNLGHGAQKPVDLFSDLLRRSVRAGDSVFDPFCGTGTIFEAAHGHKCRATGVELEPKYFGIAAQRIEGLK